MLGILRALAQFSLDSEMPCLNLVAPPSHQQTIFKLQYHLPHIFHARGKHDEQQPMPQYGRIVLALAIMNIKYKGVQCLPAHVSPASFL